MNKVTVIIPTFNEEKTVEKAINSVSWADQVIIVDSYSTDQTLPIASLSTPYILQNPYLYSANQKNWAIPQALHPWVLILDADEIITDELKMEIQETLKNPHHDAFQIFRENYFMNKKLRYVWRGDKVIRLFRKELKYEDLQVHAEIMIDNPGILKGKIEHHTYSKGLKSHLIKLDRYTTLAAKDRYETSSHIGLYHLLLKPAFRFFKHYILFRGFLDGKVGLIVSVFSSYTVFLRSLKIWRMQKGENIDN